MLTLIDTTADRRFFLRPGGHASVGRTQWADWAVPGDSVMHEIHFAVYCESGASRIRDLSDGATMLNGEPVGEALLRAGDHINAGETTFVIELSENAIACRTPVCLGPTEEKLSNEKTIREEQTPNHNAQWLSDACPAEIAEWAKLSQDAKARLSNTDGLLSAINVLVMAAPSGCHVPLFIDALRFLAFALPVQLGVRWAIDCHELTVKSPGCSLDTAALDAAKSWLADPSEENCRVAKRAAESTSLRSSSRWVAQAAAWSRGASFDLMEPDEPSTAETSVNPRKAINDDDEQRAIHFLCAQAVAGAITLMALADVPECATQRSREFVDVAQKLSLWKAC